MIKNLIGYISIGFVLGAMLYCITLFLSGGGHGIRSPYYFFFPFSEILSFNYVRIPNYALFIINCLQFPCYGAIAALIGKRMFLLIFMAMVAAVHIILYYVFLSKYA